MAVLVTEPKTRKGMTKPQRVNENYQTEPALHALVEAHPEAIYFYEDPATEFVDTNEWMEDYRVIPTSSRSFVFRHEPSNTTLLVTQQVSLETLVWLAEQHRNGVKEPRR